MALWIAAQASAQERQIRTREELEPLLLGTAGVGLTLPDLSYYWHEGDIRETADEGSIWVVHRKMIYYFIHWGLIEVDSIAPEYAAERIPKI